jgi:hypothetical protein
VPVFANRKELGPGLLSGMYKQLGIRKEDL